MIKTDLEAQIELGVTYPFPALKTGECLISTDMQRAQNGSIGDLYYIGAFVDETLAVIGERYNITAKENGWPLIYE